MRQAPPILKELYYITHVDNIPSILERGILPHERIELEGIKYTPIYDIEIVKGRKERTAPNGKSLWSFANLYFQPRNPMLYRVRCEKGVENIAVLGMDRFIFNREDAFVSTGNAAHHSSEILPPPRHLPKPKRKEFIDILKDISKMEWWKAPDGSKRKIMAELLIPDEVPPESIKSIYVANHEIAEKVKTTIDGRIPVIPDPKMFFSPYKKECLTKYLSIVEGDMFFSGMQTLTVSVNCVGVMGKGLASRAKYQFPDVYVLYQDLCRKKTLKMGRPHLHKRESSIDMELADEPESLTCANSQTWFLLFPTKTHWRYKADINGIEEGLRWIQENYQKEGMTSLAVPALGCGQGWLDWRDVGPLLCKYLSSLDIPVEIYLPAEKKISDRLISKDFLLPNTNTMLKSN